ncbi:MAG: type IX secretion system sortase PorU [Lewinellaceae bacterium]|nr:type IX secretion system sortase PorU [Phaeodactylibacter sp.]MCB9036193.1 type IX secretion system sortase PorU [Lewinellaceae bacterium]
MRSALYTLSLLLWLINTTTAQENSPLSDGLIYKIAVAEAGIYRLDYNFLKELEVDVDNIDPRTLKLYGMGGGMLPELLSQEYPEKLSEIHIHAVGEEDGRFDPGDYILFYGEGASKWRYNTAAGQFSLERNIYDKRNFYFLKAGAGAGLRIGEAAAPGSAAHTVTSFDDYARLEEDRINLLHEWVKATGSGKHWYSDHFKVARQYNYPQAFQFPNRLADEPVALQAVMALRAGSPSSFFADVNGVSFESNTVDPVPRFDKEDNTATYAIRAALNNTAVVAGENISLTVRYPHPTGPNDGSQGWLDYVQANVRRALRLEGSQMAFRDRRSLSYPASTFRLENAGANIVIWDISEPLAPAIVPVERNGQQLSFRANTNILREFIAFDAHQDFPAPEAVGPVPNQNLSAIGAVDMLILYPPALQEEALRLAQHRADQDGLTIELAAIEQVFNEYASGRSEPTAIRNFARKLRQQNGGFKYLLLFGDGSFDCRDIYGIGGNFIPTYQSESLNPVSAYPSDDYYAILDAQTGNDPLDGPLSIAVGRLPVRTAAEARAVVDKIIHYDTSEKTLGNWRNRLVFVGDDNDGSNDYDHYVDADNIAEDLNDSVRYLNLEKIYLDAFPQESTPGGERVPQATEQLNKNLFQGALAVTYLGHGGPKGWAQERVLNISDILSWENMDKMPVFITATCTFTGYDDPTFTTAGEEVMLNPKGGAIALFTTTRAVYVGGNKRLTRSTLEHLYRHEGDEPLTIGQAMQNSKNTVGSSDQGNAPKFALIGDPSMKIAIPKYGVTTLRVNEQPVETTRTDTLRALQKVTIEGAVTNAEGEVLSGFNGLIYPTIFDKPQTTTTLGQGENRVYQYRIQKNVLFKGRASVANGRFRFSFVMPKDINYQYGTGKISYYAADASSRDDAAGSYENIVIGGSDPGALADDQGPKVEVFMNTEDFVFGGIANPNPTLLVKLEDDNGINVVGNSIGHDLEGVLNDDTQNTYLLNGFYESELDDYTKGTVRYPLSKLPEGRHSIRVKAWDVANNSSEGYTEFVVAASEEIALEHVLNYPNPFTDFTCFQFDHNLANQELEVLVQVYTISGRLVKTIAATIFSDGAIRRDDCIEWDGRDDYGGRLARGVYLYTIKARAANTGNVLLSGQSEFEKLVILK